MTGGNDGTKRLDEDSSGAPIDFDRLDFVAERLSAADRFDHVEKRPESAPDRAVCRDNPRLSPSSVSTARLEIVWFENGDFSLHYHERHDGGSFDHRSDRHPSEHNTRDHVHPGPDGPTPGTDASHPRDWRDVLSMALSEIETRQRGFWIE